MPSPSSSVPSSLLDLLPLELESIIFDYRTQLRDYENVCAIVKDHVRVMSMRWYDDLEQVYGSDDDVAAFLVAKVHPFAAEAMRRWDDEPTDSVVAIIANECELAIHPFYHLV